MIRIDEIKKRLDNITEGKWIRNDQEWHYTVGTVIKPGLFSHFLTCEFGHDAEFIAKAPEDLAYLLAKVERYEKALLFIESQCDSGKHSEVAREALKDEDEPIFYRASSGVNESDVEE